MKYFLFLLTFSALIACNQGPSSHAHLLSLSPLFTDGMVLQQQTEAAFWGETAPHETIAITSSWGAKASTKTDESGTWKTTLETPKAGGPYEVTISTPSGSKTIKDVLIGEVWLAAGQSNMEMDFAYCCNTTDHAEEEIETANYPQIRMLTVEKQLSKAPTKAFKGQWKKAVGDEITNFSAVAYFYAKKLHQELNVPIGIIHASWGGTDAEAWTSREKLATLGYYDEALAAYDDLVAAANQSEAWFSQFDSEPLPSVVWYLYLGKYFGFPEKWKTLSFKDEAFIDPAYDAQHWKTLMLPGTFDHVVGTQDFDGVIVVRKAFQLTEVGGDYQLELGPISHIDFTFVNGQQIGITMGKPNAATKQYTIHSSLLKVGENALAIRVLNNYGEGSIGNIHLISSNGEKTSLAGEWKYRVSGEIYQQLNAYTFPYNALYAYDTEGIDFSQRPPKHTFHQNVKSALFNGMIYPIIPYALKGAIWYQGENNVSRYQEYEQLFPAMIADWREQWGKELPFYFVQIAPYGRYGGISAHLRDAQRKALATPKTGMVVTLDIGDPHDVHPSNKHDVGYRLAGLALADNYGGKAEASGPLYAGHDIVGNKVMLHFHHPKGLVLKPNKAGKSGFEVAGADKQFVEADARIVKYYIEVKSPLVPNPIHVRYAWSDTASATLFNGAGLPASSFSTN